MKLFPSIEKYINSLNIMSLSEERQEVLQRLLNYLKSQKVANKTIALNFICTHNSRRSHLAQVWAQAMSKYYDQSEVLCFSGGTSVTAMYPQIAVSLEEVGFQVEQLRSGDNPIYQIKYTELSMPIVGFSKKYDDNFNPVHGFAAIMVCDAAAEACPIVSGADISICITYEDPKVADNRTDKAAHYEARSKQIATEMKWVYSQL